VHVRVIGRGTFQNGQPLRRYALEMMERGARQFVVDLGQCQGMDSTFLGVLAGIGLRLAQLPGRGKVQIARISARNMELLQTLGLDRLFTIQPGNETTILSPSCREENLQKLPDSDINELNKPLNKLDTADLMLEAHDSLIRADQRNLAKFKDLTQFLRENVAKRNETDKPPQT
jgi:anti-anti-sigma regulatory factor